MMNERTENRHLLDALSRIALILRDILKTAQQILAMIRSRPPVKATIVFGTPTNKLMEKNCGSDD